jgi:integrase/recombinase XerD
MVTEKPVPLFTSVELSGLEKACRGNTFAQRRDAAIIAVFRASGIGLSELAGIRCGDLDLETREIKVLGKGRKERTVKIDCGAARRVDRYLRVRAKHEQASRSWLWLGVNNRGPVSAQGIYEMVKRRGKQAGVHVYPHRFRNHFSHTWQIDHGGAEGDLMELNGWTSPQMLRRYGASARSARARRSYDRVMEGNSGAAPG